MKKIVNDFTQALATTSFDPYETSKFSYYVCSNRIMFPFKTLVYSNNSMTVAAYFMKFTSPPVKC